MRTLVLSDALKRWIEVIQQYDFEPRYINGEYNEVPDALLRRPEFLGALITEFGLADDITQSLVEAYREGLFIKEITCRLEAKDKVTSNEFVLVNGLLFLKKAVNKRFKDEAASQGTVDDDVEAFDSAPEDLDSDRSETCSAPSTGAHGRQSLSRRRTSDYDAETGQSSSQCVGKIPMSFEGRDCELLRDLFIDKLGCLLDSGCWKKHSPDHETVSQSPGIMASQSAVLTPKDVAIQQAALQEAQLQRALGERKAEKERMIRRRARMQRRETDIEELETMDLTNMDDDVRVVRRALLGVIEMQEHQTTILHDIQQSLAILAKRSQAAPSPAGPGAWPVPYPPFFVPPVTGVSPCVAPSTVAIVSLGMPLSGGVTTGSSLQVPVQTVFTPSPSQVAVTTQPVVSQPVQPLGTQPQQLAHQPVSPGPQPGMMQGPGQTQWVPKTAIAAPKPFTGDKRGEDLDTWLRAVPVYVRCKLTLPHEEVLVAASYLEGSAARWLSDLVQLQGYGHDFRAWAASQKLEDFLKMVEERRHDPQEAQRATDAILTLHTRQFKSVREATDTVERLICVPGVRYDPQVLLTSYLRWFSQPLRNQLAKEANINMHNFPSFSKVALDLEAKIGHGQAPTTKGRKKTLPPNWKAKGRLMFVDNDGSTIELDGNLQEGVGSEAGSLDASEGGVVAAVAQKGPGDERRLRREARERAAARRVREAEDSVRTRITASTGAAMATSSTMSQTSSQSTSSGVIQSGAQGSISQTASLQLTAEDLEIRQAEELQDELQRQLAEAAERRRKAILRKARLGSRMQELGRLEVLDEAALDPVVRVLHSALLSVAEAQNVQQELLAELVAGQKQILAELRVPRTTVRQPQFVVVPAAGAGPSSTPQHTGSTFSPMFGIPPPGGLVATSGPVHRVSTVPSTTVVTTVPLSSQAQVSVQQPVSVAMQPLQQAPGPMQPMQWMPKIPLMSPKPFSGDKKKEEDLDTWVRTVPTYVRHKLTRPEQEVVVAASFLEGSAAHWLNGLVQQQGYGQNFDAWAQAHTLEEFVRSVYNRWHDPQGAQKATDAINNLCARRFNDVRELTDTVERLLVVPGVRFGQQVLLTDYLRCLPAEVRNKLVDEAYVEQHTFASFSKKALDIEAKLGSAHKASYDGRKRLPQDWKKKGQLMFVDHDGQKTEIDDFPDLGELTEQDGASETSDGGFVAPIKEKARGTGKKKVVRSTGQGDQGTPAWVKIGLDYEDQGRSTIASPKTKMKFGNENDAINRPSEGGGAGPSRERKTAKRKLYIGYLSKQVVGRGARKQVCRGPSPPRKGEGIYVSLGSESEKERTSMGEAGRSGGERAQASAEKKVEECKQREPWCEGSEEKQDRNDGCEEGEEGRESLHEERGGHDSREGRYMDFGEGYERRADVPYNLDPKNSMGEFSPVRTGEGEDEEEEVQEVIEISSGDERDEISRPREERRPPTNRPR
ncbi:hypothetical protein CBR_g40281 [Chara braunii]|uniref:Uncharacterized protein n=1 Tax=Chara braunii TaxID=69332 RepID=A0A388K1V5_CHABU|nr:hypothetical protein CBR_g40281 [Chara braunii]|eukprot:GBG64034.1 hypothetical protein CBR_g40281 [Chara braunii]